jgi:hypothetical protein
MEVLSLQRQRIDNLELEYDALYGRYEDILGRKLITAEEIISK